jgi:plastocyanin
MNPIRKPGIFVLYILLISNFNIIASAKTDTVRIAGMTFQPATLRIKAGATVVWINPTTVLHTSTSGTNCNPDGKWNSGYMDHGKIFRHTFKAAGRYPYFCMPHCLSGMKGIIIVSGPAAKPPQKQEATNKENKESKKTNEKPEQQQQDTSQTASDSTEKEIYPKIFADTRIVTAQSPETLGKRILDVRISHRFDDLAAPLGGFHHFYGFDNIRDVRLAIEYGITDNLMIGIARNKGDYDVFHETQIKELYELLGKYRLLRQKTDGSTPLSVTLHGNIVFSAMKKDTTPYSEGHFNNEWNRFSFELQALVARKFNSKLSLEVMPTYIRRNWTTFGDEADLFALGLGARYSINERFAIVGDYFYPFSSFRQSRGGEYQNPMGIGLEINTGGHVFTINFTNSTSLIDNTYIPYTTANWLKGQFRLGFTIARKFNIRKKG